MKSFKKYYRKIFPNYLMELEDAIGEYESLLDVGCGENSPIKDFSKELYCVGIDVFSQSIKKSKKLKIHNEYYQMNILDIEKKFTSNFFDCVVALDIIEHITKEDGLRLMKMMEKIARKRVVIFTPNGFLPQGEFEGNSWQVHKSGWDVEEMEESGYKVIGINGWKFLRGKYADLRFRPRVFWLIVSNITQLFIRNKPESAFQILCTKEIKGEGIGGE